MYDISISAIKKIPIVIDTKKNIKLLINLSLTPNQYKTELLNNQLVISVVTLLLYSKMNSYYFLNDLIVLTPAIVSDKKPSN